MSPSQNLTGRQVALGVLSSYKINSHDASNLLGKNLSKTQEKGRASDLVYGVIRNLNLIDYVLSNTARFDPERVNKRLLNTIRIGAYELLFSHATPDYAIVDQAVGVVSSKKGRGFVNAVLRSMARSIKLRSCDWAGEFSKNNLPVAKDVAVVFYDEILPDPESDFVQYLSVVFSLPKWLLKQWQGEFGSEKTLGICFGSNRRPSVYMRPNITKNSAVDLRKYLLEKEISSESVSPQMLRLAQTTSIGQLEEFQTGLFTVQDLTASKVAIFLAPKDGEIIADLCAAPGTKTSHIAELLGGKGRVIATDIDDSRLMKVGENAQRLGLSAIETCSYDDAFAKIDKAKATTILLDVPCSNTGVMARRCELRHRIDSHAIKSLINTQHKLLQKVADELSHCHRICYSTCSVMPDENSQVIQWFLKHNTSFELERSELTLPTSVTPDWDGGYVAVLVRKK